MSMTNRLIIICVILFAHINLTAQEKWDLRRAVEYARDKNISVKQADIQARLSELTLQQSRLSQYPTLNFELGSSFRAGRSLDYTTYELTNTSFLSTSPSLSSNVLLFNWFARRNAIASNDLAFRADLANIDKLKDDISLNVANAYLQILLAVEQVKVSEVQLAQSKAQLENTRKLVKAGSLPELNAAEAEAQMARDSSQLVGAKNAVELNKLQLKAILTIEAGAPFDVETPPVESIPIESFADLVPEYVYQQALVNRPQMKVSSLRLQSLQKLYEATRAQLYPSISMNAGLASQLRTKAPLYGKGTPTYIKPIIGTVQGGGQQVESIVPSPVFPEYLKPNVFKQINENFSQYIGLSLAVPIFNGGTARTNTEKAKLNIKNQELTIEQDKLTIKQDIFTAYYNALGAYEKFQAGKKTVESAQKAYDFALKRYDVGLLNTIDLITNQNNLFRAKIDLLTNQFEYVFRMKVLEFYKGQGIKL